MLAIHSSASPHSSGYIARVNCCAWMCQSHADAGGRGPVVPVVNWPYVCGYCYLVPIDTA